MTTLVPVNDLLTDRTKVNALVAAMGAVFPLVTVRAETRALATTGLQAQTFIDKIAVDIEVAQSLEIDSDDMLTEAQEIASKLAAVCADDGLLDNERKALTAPFWDIKKALDAGYAVPRTFIQDVLDSINRKVLEYNRVKREEQAKRDREAEAKRQQDLADARKKEQETQAAAQKLVDEAATAPTQEAAQALLEQASQVADAGRAEAQVAVAAASTRVVLSGGHAVRGVKAKGVRGTYKGRIKEPLHENKIRAIVHIAAQLAAGNEANLHLIDFPEATLNRQAAMQGEAFNVPGLEAFFVESVSNRKAPL